MKQLFFALAFIISVSSLAQVNKIAGRWKTIDDKDGSVKSIVLIYKATNGKYYGKVEKLFKNPELKCKSCEGPNKDKPVVGMMIISNMVDDETILTGGNILDPQSGKLYHCSMSLQDNAEKLKVRGSLDKNGFLGRTQYWLRAN